MIYVSFVSAAKPQTTVSGNIEEMARLRAQNHPDTENQYENTYAQIDEVQNSHNHDNDNIRGEQWILENGLNGSDILINQIWVMCGHARCLGEFCYFSRLQNHILNNHDIKRNPRFLSFSMFKPSDLYSMEIRIKSI